eukprot:gnl/TRDRNA2_/TRDRNA2_80098_c0_seq1.p1 gnl/TRDRNA2_/TRDRNA2_80098_c0~~gnl/TRDRNA2_/TRDRNA2_80098_c0_seq1.p1  ORF type:complete len:289 (-),score=32.27 gnl/TRDRNA2_/TRDRNA2_80098_c0_seq1:846-1712(-)
MSISSCSDHAKYVLKWLREISDDVEWLRSHSAFPSRDPPTRSLQRHLAFARLPQLHEVKELEPNSLEHELFLAELSLERFAATLKYTRRASESAVKKSCGAERRQSIVTLPSHEELAISPSSSLESTDEELWAYTPRCYHQDMNKSPISTHSTDAGSEEIRVQPADTEQSRQAYMQDVQSITCSLSCTDPGRCNHVSPMAPPLAGPRNALATAVPRGTFSARGPVPWALPIFEPATSSIRDLISLCAELEYHAKAGQSPSGDPTRNCTLASSISQVASFPERGVQEQT